MKTPDKQDGNSKTIFHSLLQSDLPEKEKETWRLAEEAVLLVGAGTHTTSWCLTVMAFHLLHNANLLRKLKQELASVKDISDYSELERLPYLTGVLKEGLRLGYGVSVRSARIAPDTSLKCGDHIIPAGTPVSMTIPLTHHNEALFENSYAFDPDRWTGVGSSRLDKYLVSFSRGSRSCLGINLAWAELYLCTAGIFSKFGSREARASGDLGFLELYETNEEDVRMESDMFLPVMKQGSKGVRARVHLLT